MSIQTIEQTGKLWKFIQLVGVLGVLVGTGMIFVMLLDGCSPAVGAWGTVAVLLGLPIWAIGRVGAWWFHG